MTTAIDEGRTPMRPKRYIHVERVSSMNGRKEDEETTHTLADQRKLAGGAMEAVGGQIVHRIKCLDQSGFTVLPTIVDEIVDWVGRGDADGIVIGYASRLARNWWDAGSFFTALSKVDAEIIDGEDPLGPDYRSDKGRTI